MLISEEQYKENYRVKQIQELAKLPIEQLIIRCNQINNGTILTYGNLFYWIPVLNRFDAILADAIRKYDLDPTSSNQEEQKKDSGSENNSNNSSRVRRGLLLFLFENIVAYCCNGFGPYSFALGLPFLQNK